MRISDWSSDVCSSDLHFAKAHPVPRVRANAIAALAAVAEGEGRAALLERGTRDVDARVRDDCKRWLASYAPSRLREGQGRGLARVVFPHHGLAHPTRQGSHVRGRGKEWVSKSRSKR